MKRDKATLDLFAWEPPAVTKSFAPEQIRAASIRAMISRAVAAALKDSDLDRDAISAEISAFLDETCSKSMLDAYASEAREGHKITVERFLGVVHATKDIRLMQVLASQFGWAVIPNRYLAAVEEAMWTDQEERAKRERLAARGRWKGE